MHREQHVGPASGEPEQGPGVVLALGDLLVVVGPPCRIARAANAEREKARSGCLFPLLEVRPPRFEDPEFRVAGARPA